jgi:hypothetical protein
MIVQVLWYIHGNELIAYRMHKKYERVMSKEHSCAAFMYVRSVGPPTGGYDISNNRQRISARYV